MIGRTSSSSFARVSGRARCFGPSCVAVRNGRLTWVSSVEESSILAFSAASRTRCIAILSFRMSMPDSFWNSPAMNSVSALSMSVPPSWVSPLVDTTSNTPSPNSMIVTSSVPPPRSKTRIFCDLPALSSP